MSVKIHIESHGYPGETFTTKLGKHIWCGHSIPTLRAFDDIENK